MASLATSPCLEACRAAALASHSAAGLVTSLRKVAGSSSAKLGEVARLLRSSEALARAAVAALNSMATEARAAPLASKGGEQAGHTAGSGKPKRRRRKKKSAETEVLPYEVVAGSMAVEGPAKASTSMASGASLKATSNSCSASATQGMAESKPFYLVGASVVIIGLASRTDLEGKICKVIAPGSQAGGERVAVQTPEGEKLLVKHLNLRASLFPASWS